MKYLSILVVFVLLVGCKEWEIEQDVTKFTKGYNVNTRIWHYNEIVWSHYTFQEERLYIPVDSIPNVKKRDYENAERVMDILKKANLK